MKIHNNIYYFFIISISLFIGYFIWPLIKLSNSNLDIIGEYSQNNYNSLNDFIRYFFFISIPLVSFFFSKVYFEKKKINEFFINLKTENSIINSDYKIYFFLFFIIIFILFEFFSLSFLVKKIDLFHDGQQLSSSYKNIIDETLWSGSYIVIGIFYETLANKILWETFDIKSIGLARFTNLLYIITTKILLVLLSFEITKKINLSKLSKYVFFTLLSLILLSCIDYNLNSGEIISFREITILLTLIFFINSINSNKVINYIFIGIIFVASFLWSLDRAIVLTIFLIFLLFYLAFNKKHIQLITLLLSVFFCWLILYLIFNDEFIFFISNTLSVIKEHTYINGIIHPLPFSDERNSTRATKNLLVILFSLIISINILFKNKTRYPNNLKIILLTLAIFCGLSYVYALGRSDGPHIKQTLAFPVIFFTTFFLYEILYFFSKSINKLEIKKNNILFLAPILFLYIFIINIDFNNIKNYSQRFSSFISLEDKNFLNEEDIIFINETSKILENEKCIQLFTNDAALLYLLKKPSCTKFYFVYSIGSNKNQNEFIAELENTNFLILNGKTDSWGVPLNIKYPLINKYINENYINFKKVGSRLLKIKKN
tara:strand:+ start:4398 stop:6203 length:1806 start_codon:yes stop_codon:yes gene_type:complete